MSADAVTNGHRLLTADELSARWQVEKGHVYRLAREGRLPTVRLGRYMRWRLEAIEEFERGGGTNVDAAS
jgi:excisionase family DNA binding protein